MSFDYTLHYFVNIAVLTTISVLFFVYYYDFMVANPDEDDAYRMPFSKLSSSVWCQTTQNGDKICSFKNICYTTSVGFVFVLNEKSQVYGIENLNDLLKIKTSSITNHPLFYLKLNVVKQMKQVNYITRKIFAMARFKPDNIHHVIHDDLLPLFFRYSQLCLGDVAKCSSDHQLLFIDNHEINYFVEWYKLFSDLQPLTLSSLEKFDTVCFKELTLGLGEETIFYQYGFGKPHGPVKASIYGQVLTNFRDYILKHLNIKQVKPVSTLLLRKVNRKILNEDFVFKSLKKMSAIKKLVHVDVTSNHTSQLLSTISSSNLLFGMHGAGMILSLFLPPNAIVIELFPFAIQKHVSPVHSLLNINGIKFAYYSWTNLNESNSVTHPEYPINYGGLDDLDENEKLIIKKSKIVDPVECCNNRTFLYRMYQDTYIDDTIETVILKAFNNQKYQNLFENFYYPSQVRNIKCFKRTQLLVTWDPPFNIMNFSPLYKIDIRTVNGSYSDLTAKNNITWNQTDENLEHQIWIICIVNGTPSLESYITC